MIYSIDTSALIEGWIREIPPDIFYSVWEKIEILIDDGKLVATEEVLFDLEKKHDAVHNWALQHEQMFIQIDEKIQETVKHILRNYSRLVDIRKNRSGSDPFVIALAADNNLSVVTDEKPSGNILRPKIPDVCVAMNIRYLNIIDLCREQNWKF